MLDFLKNYYIFMLVLMVFSYLVPKEEYKRYIQFFISIFIVVLLLRPVIKIFMVDDVNGLYETFEQFFNQLENLDIKAEEGKNIFEHFFFEGTGE